MVMVNNLRTFGESERHELANSPELLNLWVEAFGTDGNLIVEVREATSVDDAKARAKDALAGLGVAPSGATVEDVYLVTGDSAMGPADGSKLCKAGQRWDPITRTCVPE